MHRLIEKLYPDAKLKYKEPLIDVDGTEIVTYTVNGKAIITLNIIWEDEIWIRSEIDLSDIDFSNIKQF